MNINNQRVSESISAMVMRLANWPIL